ncbi:hypothetical protein BH23PLA1_BH23PLA1_39660 [soil metagenome]
MTVPKLVPVDHPEVSPRPITNRLRSQLVYFMSAPDAAGVPKMGENEYWIAEADVRRALEDGVLMLVSPLDSANATEVELTEEQEDLLQWLLDQSVQHVRVEGA